MPPRWWKSLRQRFLPARPRPRQGSCRPSLEALEHRLLLNTAPLGPNPAANQGILSSPILPPAGILHPFGVSITSAGVTAGHSVKVTLTALDASGHPLTSYAGTVHFASSDDQATLPGDYTFAASDKGVHTFTLTLRTAGLQEVSFSNASQNETDASFFVTPTAPDHLVFSGQPGTTPVGVGQPVEVAVEDAFDNIVTSDSHDSVTLTLANNPGHATLHGTTQAKVDNGVADFANVSVDQTGTGYSLSAGMSGVSHVSSQAFDVTVNDLDPTFGTGGKVATDFIGGLALEPDGKIVTVGLAGLGGNPAVELTEYNADGSLNKAFGHGGKVLLDIPPQQVTAPILTVGTDGKITLAASISGTVPSFVVERFKPDGSPDTTFGSGGKLTLAIGQLALAGPNLFFGPNGKMVLVINTNSATSAAVVLARYNSDGSLDTSFGTGGLLTTDFSQNSLQDVLLQADGKVIVATTVPPIAPVPPGMPTVVLARYNSDGSLDSTFGIGGLVALPVNSNPQVKLALQSDGKILVAANPLPFAIPLTPGSPNLGSSPNVLLFRYKSNGSLDTSFGTGGEVATDFTQDSVQRLITEPDGKIVLVVTSANPAVSTSTVARYNRDGSLDTTFGTGGELAPQFAPGIQSSIMAVQPDGGVLVSGATPSQSSTGFSPFLARFLGEHHPLSANAGGPYTLAVGGTLKLDASASTAPAGVTLTYSWDLTGKGTFGQAIGVQPTLTWSQLQALGINHPETLTKVRVRVDDGQGHVLISAPTSLTITKAATTTSLAPLPRLVAGQKFDLTAVVHAPPAAGIPTGMVTFRDGNTVLGKVPLDAHGKATLHVLGVKAGSHSLTAVYSGDGNFKGSTSAPLKPIVGKAKSSVGLTSSIHPSVFGQLITLTATVSPVGPGSGRPGGKVAFWDGTTLLGTAVVDHTGHARLPTAKLSRTLHSIKAVYGGDSNFLGSTSAFLMQRVK